MSYLGEDIPKLGFGMMRLPRLEDGSTDIEQVKKMVDAFMTAGLKYFDTARAYEGSEDAIRQAVVERYPRDSYYIATKAAAWAGAKSIEDIEEMFETSLSTLGVDYVDFYLLHNIGNDRTQFFDKYDMWGFVEKQKELGRVKHIGFSMHDVADVLEKALQDHPSMEFVQLQVNWSDWNAGGVQARECMEVAQKYGVPVVIMEPVRGGTLADPPHGVAEIFANATPQMPPAEWALRFCWNLPNVLTVLSGMSTLEQVQLNIESYKRFEPPLTDGEMEVYAAAQKAMEAAVAVPCTSCKYCMKVCPMGINIAGIFAAVNRASQFTFKQGQFWYGFMTREAKGSDCVKCGQCVMACPQHINVVEEIAKAVEQFEDPSLEPVGPS